MGMQLIETVTVGSGGAASIEFTSIPQDGVDIVMLYSCTSTSGSNYNDMELAINGSGANLSNKYLQYNSSTIYTGSNLYPSGRGIGYGSGGTNLFTNGQLYFPNYTSSDNKNFDVTSVFAASSAPGGNLIAGKNSSTAAITSLKILYVGYNFAQYSTASLYKITAD